MVGFHCSIIQGATSHHLGQNFSKMFDICIEDPSTVRNGEGKRAIKDKGWRGREREIVEGLGKRGEREIVGGSGKEVRQRETMTEREREAWVSTKNVKGYWFLVR